VDLWLEVDPWLEGVQSVGQLQVVLLVDLSVADSLVADSLRQSVLSLR
jgi:hypothetical protein